jgi:hypothetical protein
MILARLLHYTIGAIQTFSGLFLDCERGFSLYGISEPPDGCNAIDRCSILIKDR